MMCTVADTGAIPKEVMTNHLPPPSSRTYEYALAFELILKWGMLYLRSGA